MNSQKTTTTNPDLTSQLVQLGLRSTAENLDDLIARATRGRLSPRALIEEMVAAELAARTSHRLQRLLTSAHRPL